MVEAPSLETCCLDHEVMVAWTPKAHHLTYFQGPHTDPIATACEASSNEVGPATAQATPAAAADDAETPQQLGPKSFARAESSPAPRLHYVSRS